MDIMEQSFYKTKQADKADRQKAKAIHQFSHMYTYNRVNHACPLNQLPVHYIFALYMEEDGTKLMLCF